MFRERLDCLKQMVEALILKQSAKSPSTHDEWKNTALHLLISENMAAVMKAMC